VDQYIPTVMMDCPWSSAFPRGSVVKNPKRLWWPFLNIIWVADSMTRFTHPVEYLFVIEWMDQHNIWCGYSWCSLVDPGHFSSNHYQVDTFGSEWNLLYVHTPLRMNCIFPDPSSEQNASKHTTFPSTNLLEHRHKIPLTNQITNHPVRPVLRGFNHAAKSKWL